MTVPPSQDSRPSRPTIDQIRAVCQPDEIRQRRSAEHWTADLYLRTISPFVTRPLVNAGFSANGVTYLMIASGILAGVVLLIPGILGALLAVFFGQLQLLFDCCDGEVARWRNTSSAMGIFLDSLGHYEAEMAICVALGVRAAGSLSEPSWWIFAGLVLSLVVFFNRLMNEMVASTRLAVGLPKLPDTTAVANSQARGIRRIKQMARFMPLHRLLHSVELTLLILAAAVADWLMSDLTATRLLLVLLLPGTLLVAAAHLAAIVTSQRLRAPGAR